MEDEFPNSDNASKLKRSCENAEHVGKFSFPFLLQSMCSSHQGLFAPSAGQHLRDEQRRRRSQYDRGTSLAEREEYDFEILEPFDNTQGLYNFHPCKFERTDPSRGSSHSNRRLSLTPIPLSATDLAHYHPIIATLRLHDNANLLGSTESPADEHTSAPTILR
jgi:hypothetical protein